MIRTAAAAIAATTCLGLAGVATAQTCAAYPYALANGQTADANQVMANFNCAALLNSPHFTGNIDVSGIPDQGQVFFRSGGRPFLNIKGGVNSYKTLRFSDGADNLWKWDINVVPGNDASTPDALQFWSPTVGRPTVSFLQGGNVGIGTTAPLSPLSVSGQVVIGGPYRGDASLQIIGAYGGAGRLTQMSPTGASQPALNLMASTDASGYYNWWSWGVNNGAWTINPGTGFGQTFTINGTGVGIGKTASQSILDINGEITTNGGIRMTTPGGSMKAHLYEQSNDYLVFTNTNASGGAAGIFYMQSDVDNAPIVWVAPFAYASDRRMKKNVEPVSGALSIVNKLRPVRYDWLAPSEQTVGKQLHIGNTKRQIGFIAQEVAAVVPEAVNAPANADDPYTMDPAKLIPILVQGMKEQQAEIETLKAQVAALKGGR